MVKRDSRQTVAHRLKIARGHLDRVIRMVEAGDYCIDVLTQSQAVQSALKEADAKLLADHLTHCVADAVRGNEKDKAVEEVIKVFRRAR